MYRKHRRAPRKRTEILVNVTSRRCRNSNRASFFPCSSASIFASSATHSPRLPIVLRGTGARRVFGANQPITNPRPTGPNIPRHLHTLFTPPAFSSYRIIPGSPRTNIVRPLLIGFIFAAQTEERPNSLRPQSLNAVSTNPTIANFSTL